MYVLVIYSLLAGLLLVQMAGSFKQGRNIELVVFFLLMAFFALRFNLGPDTGTYYYIFQRVSSPIADSLKYHMQRNVGFNILLYYCKVIFKNYQMFVLTVNLLILWLCGSNILKYSKNILFSALLFIGSGILEVYYSSGIRQMLSMAVFFYAFYRFLPKKQYWQYELLSLVAFSFHEIGIITFFIPLLDMYLHALQKNPQKTVRWSIVLCAVLTLVVSYLLPYLSSTLGYSTTITHGLIYFAKPSFSFMGLAMEIVFGVMLWLFWNAADPRQLSEFDKLQMAVIFLSIGLYIIGCRYSIISRLSDYLQIVMIILIPNLIAAMGGKKQMLCFMFTALLNGFLLYSDLTYKCTRLSVHENRTVTLTNYTYFTVFDNDQIQNYLEIIQ
jgi:hypothetical protein